MDYAFLCEFEELRSPLRDVLSQVGPHRCHALGHESGASPDCHHKLCVELLPITNQCIRAARVELLCSARARRYVCVHVRPYNRLRVLIRVAGCTATRS